MLVIVDKSIFFSNKIFTVVINIIIKILKIEVFLLFLDRKVYQSFFKLSIIYFISLNITDQTHIVVCDFELKENMTINTIFNNYEMVKRYT